MDVNQEFLQRGWQSVMTAWRNTLESVPSHAVVFFSGEGHASATCTSQHVTNIEQW